MSHLLTNYPLSAFALDTYLITKYRLELIPYPTQPNTIPSSWVLVTTTADNKLLALRNFENCDDTNTINVLREIHIIFSAIENNQLKFYEFAPTRQVFVCNDLDQLIHVFFAKTNGNFKKLIFDANNYNEICWNAPILPATKAKAEIQYFSFLFEIEIYEEKITPSEIVPERELGDSPFLQMDRFLEAFSEDKLEKIDTSESSQVSKPLAESLINRNKF